MTETRVLVLLPSPRDIERTAQLLGEANLACVGCLSIFALCEEIRAGAGAVVLTDEIITTDVDRHIEAVLREQPAWSALPLLVLAREREGRGAQLGSLAAYKSITIIERPIRTRSIISAVQSALRTRRNQYEIRDAISERERQSAELLAQDERLRFALSAGRLGSWEIDLQSYDMVSSEICKVIYGWPLDQPFSYQQLEESIHEQDRRRVRNEMTRAIETKGLFDVEYRVVWPNGETHWAMARGRATYESDGSATKMIGVSLDVTERERLHEALRHSENQLRTADRLKDEFLATLAHELRNPLAPISSGLSLLSDSSDPAVMQKTIGIMDRQVRHMTRLIDDLLDVSRITRGKMELKRERVTVAGIVQSAIEGSAPNLSRAQHELTTSITDEALFLDADHTRMAQVISNLLNNASKFTPNGGTIRLAVRRDANEVVIEVSDNGLGIPTDRLDDIFELFGQVNRALDRSQGGLGIGLALVRKLVEMHGGSVAAHSNGPGTGSSFKVRLPLVSPPTEPVRANGAAKAIPAKLRVLIVDDNEDAAEMLALMLEQHGCQTSTVYDGPEALEAAAKLTPDVVVLDIGLPGMSGYQVAERIRLDERLARTALIALTGWGTPEDRRKAMEAGFDFHLTKPVAADALQSTLAKATQLRR